MREYKGISVKRIKRLRSFLEWCFSHRVYILENISSQSIYYCGQADARLKEKKGTLGGKSENFSDTTTCSGNSHPFHRVLRDTPAQSGINSRASSLLWRPSILRALSFWDTEKQISPLTFSGQTNGKPSGSLRDILPRRFDESVLWD